MPNRGEPEEEILEAGDCDTRVVVHLVVFASQCGGSESSTRRNTMAKVGNVLENPVSDQRLIFRKAAQDTGGELL